MTGTHLDIDAGDVSSAEELDLMFVLVDRVVVDARVLAGVPVEHELAVVETTNSLLATSDAEIALLQLPVSTTDTVPTHLSTHYLRQEGYAFIGVC